MSSFFEGLVPLTPIAAFFAVAIFTGWAVVWIIGRKRKGTWEVMQVLAVGIFIIFGIRVLLNLNLSTWQLWLVILSVLVVAAVVYSIWQEHKSTPNIYSGNH